MEVQEFDIKGPKLFTLKAHSDDRGFFCERFRVNIFNEEHQLPNFVQDNFSRSAPKVLRGLHYQWDKPQGKLVTVLHGEIFDVAVDIRKNSPTFGQHISLTLKDSLPQWFWIPPGFAHGFCVIGEQTADVMYKVDNYWNGKGESGIVWNDVDLKINWPIQAPLLSSKDGQMQNFKNYAQEAKFL